MPDEQRLCLYGDLAKPFIKGSVGDKVTISVEAVLTSAGLEPDYSASGPVEANGKDKQPKKRPRVEFVIAKVNGRGGKTIQDMDGEEFEKEVAKAKGY